MNWLKRLRQWVEVIRLAHGEGTRVPWFGMLVAILSGPVPRSVWRHRMRTCMQCPFYSEHQMPGTTKRTDRAPRCFSVHPKLYGRGCKCSLPMKALTATAGRKGCYARDLNPEMGWPNHRFLSPLTKLRALVLFILAKN